MPTRVLILLGLTLCCVSCSTLKSAVNNHARLAPWARAASPANPNQWPNLALLATYPYWNQEDSRLSKHLASNKKYAGERGEEKGDIVAAVLTTLPILPLSYDWIRGDESGHFLEVVAESTIINVALTEGLKRAVGRERPNDNSGEGGRLTASERSFPSGHVVGSMTGAALVGRWLREKSLWYIPAELALYAGVGYVGVTRVENDKHWPTDVVFSAFMANYVVNTVWDAHYGRDGHGGIFERLPKPVPVPIEDGFGVMFGIPF